MLKKFFNVFIMTVVLIVVSNNQAFAYRAAVILDTPSGMFSDPEKVYKTLQTSFDNIFGAGSDIMPLGETDSYVQIYREEHDLIYTADIDDSTQTSNRDLILKKEDILRTFVCCYICLFPVLQQKQLLCNCHRSKSYLQILC